MAVRKIQKQKGIGLMNEVAAAPIRMTREAAEREMRYRAESDLRTLRDADEIRQDPQRMRLVKRHATEQVKAVSRVIGAPRKGKNGGRV